MSAPGAKAQHPRVGAWLSRIDAQHRVTTALEEGGIWGQSGEPAEKWARPELGERPALDCVAAPAHCWREGAFTPAVRETHPGRPAPTRFAVKGLSHWRLCERGSGLGSMRGADSGEEALEGRIEVPHG